MNWDYAEALTTADRHAFFKFMVKIDRREARRARHLHAQAFSVDLTGNRAATRISRYGEASDCIFADDADPSWECRATAYAISWAG